ncbi:MAG: aminopeptidase N [Alphaproteobacteria bacterium]
MKTENAPQTKYLKDYKRPEYQVSNVDLEFDLDPETTKVKSTLKIKSEYDRTGGVKPMHLDGDELDFVSVAINGRKLNPEEYLVDEKGLTILNPPAEFTMTVENNIHPVKNTKLEGLYMAGDVFCTQCEPEGFRRITYYPDRPDVLAKFTTLVKGDKDKLPVLMSNGNPVEKGELPDGRHFAKVEDPFPKPSYLFALVAGDLDSVKDTFVTRSGKEVKLGVFVEKGKADKATYALDSLKRVLQHDESKWGLEYKHDVFNVVAVSAFNQGAMENTTLNIFNDKLVLASPDTATDADYGRIEGVIGHEAQHYHSGNLVTVENWFNLTLKEGLTVFRDHEFSSDMRSRPVQRIQDVKDLRAGQFPEDAGPLAHPIKPKSYVEMNNFYTSTIYEKGCEVIRMTQQLLGEENFKKAKSLYFQRHYGQAVSTENWLKAMEDGGNIDLTQFHRWYDQAGTPNVSAEGKYNPETKTYELTLKQSTKPTPGQPTKEPFMMPIEVGLLGADGKDMALNLKGQKGEAETSKVLVFKDGEQKFVFENVNEEPVLSINRGFTSPINLDVKYSTQEKAFLMSHDSDAFNRFEIGQQYAVDVMKSMIKEIQAGKEPKVDPAFVEAFGSYLKDPSLEKAFVAEAMRLPSENYMAQQLDVVDVDAISKARSVLNKVVAETYKEDFAKLYKDNQSDKPFEPTVEQAGERSVKNLALSYQAKLETAETKATVFEAYAASSNMTDRMGALSTLVNSDNPKKQDALDDFYDRYKEDPLVINKWLTVQATADSPDVLNKVKELTEHEAFDIKNPNKVRSLVGAYTNSNPKSFHAKDGSGYQFLVDFVKKYDDVNPMTAAKLVKPLGDWKKFDEERQDLMKSALKDILAKPNLSRNVYEIASKSLGEEDEKDKVKKTLVEKKEVHKKVASFGKGQNVTSFVCGSKASAKTRVQNNLLKAVRCEESNVTVVPPSMPASNILKLKQRDR